MPKEPGIYFFKSANNKVLYVGKAKDLRARVASYFLPSVPLGAKTQSLVDKTTKIKVIVVFSEVESLLLEAKYVKKHQPFYNIRLRDDKTYPSIRITIKHKYPGVLYARKTDDRNSIYFGPFPNASAVKLVLHTIRRIFPFQSVLNHPKKLCLYNHLGLCPCQPVNDSAKEKLEYKRILKQIIDFLNGDIKKVIKSLERQRSILSKNEKFEEAYKIQKKLDAIYLITQPVRAPFEYELNPNLSSDVRKSSLLDLRNLLTKHGMRVGPIQKIECYDISNLQGTNSTGSMVVFVDGEKESALYRKFKIRNLANNLPNDFASIQEVLQRRIRHNEWEFPDLVVIDGGKGQVSAAYAILKPFGIPVIGLAKRLEKVITDTKKEVVLPRRSDALLLLMRIRDEAHRFALSYHRKLRIKSLSL